MRFWFYVIFLLSTLTLSMPQDLIADSQKAQDKLRRADALAEKEELWAYKEAFELYKQAVQLAPENYEANWKMARAYHFAGVHAKHTEAPDWQELCADYGKKGMQHAEKAIELNPEGVHGHLYFGLCAGVYTDGVSIVTAIVQGLRDKAQEHLQRAYELDKEYQNGIPALALGRYWAILPWMAGRDREKALEYYQEADQIMPEDSPHRTELHYYKGKLLLQMGQKEQKALSLLQKTAESDHDYFRSQAREKLDKHQHDNY